MTRAASILAAAALAVVWAAPAAGSLGTSLGHDLDALWAAARARHDLARHDAVLLLESRLVSIAADGAVSTRVHRVVWIGTAIGLGAHADLRVPWHEQTSTLQVERLRTWRDGRWWPHPEEISDTAVVHTLPHALARAHDYTAMRETMLLHDGVELPCILETAYTITTRPPAGAGSSGLFVLPQRDPALLTTFTLMAPATTPLTYRALHGAPEPLADDDAVRTLSWVVHEQPARAWPLLPSPLHGEPTVVWSTWRDHAWQDTWRAAFNDAATVDDDLMQAARKHLDLAAGRHDEVAAAARWLDEAVRPVSYDPRHWALGPRPAARTWATAYGHALDRAVLLAAVLRERGHAVTPLLLVEAPDSLVDRLPPALAAAVAEAEGELCLLVGTDRGEWRHVDLKTGAVHGPWHRPTAARLAIAPGALLTRGDHAAGRLEVTFVLEPDPAGGWRGRGEVAGHGTGGLADLILARDGDLDGLARHLAGGVLDGAVFTSAVPRRVDGVAGVLTFDVALAAFEAGKPRRFVIGAPRGGLRDRLPGDVNLADQARATAVELGAARSQRVTVRLRVPDGEVVHVPPARRLENAAGTMTAVCERDGDWLGYTRSVSVDHARIPAADWPALRALLLEEHDANAATLVLVPAR